MEKQGIFVHALHKSASMFLWKLLGTITERHQFNYFSDNNTPPNTPKLKPWQFKNFCVGPIREFEKTNTPFIFIKNKHHIYQVRDPRDILVSQYFSFGWIHGQNYWDEGKLKEREYIQSLSIDEYVLSRAVNDDFGDRPALQTRFNPLRNKHKSNNQRTFIKYEDMVLNFRDWLSMFIAPFDILNKEEEIEYCYALYQHEFITDGKEEMKHKRKMLPGDYLEKLKPETIQQLNEIFKPELELFKYEF